MTKANSSNRSTRSASAFWATFHASGDRRHTTTQKSTLDETEYHVTEHYLTNSECEQTYGSSDIHEVNRQLETKMPNVRAYLPECSGGLVFRTIHRESEGE